MMKLMQKGDNFFIFHSLLANIMTDLLSLNSPRTQELSLAFRDIFIQNIHEPVTTRSGTCETRALLASVTASDIASLVIAPRHSSIMASHAIPLATCSSTSATKIRVPLKTG